MGGETQIMKEQTKQCRICGSEFFRKRQNLKWWATAKFCSVKCSSVSKIGKPGGMLGKRHSSEAITKIKSYRHTEEAKRRISLSGVGNEYAKGKKHTEATKKRIGDALRGENNSRWIPIRTVAMERHALRNSQEWKVWRGLVFERDLYTCQDCGDSGVYIEAHHITPLRLDRSRVTDINNGITLCRPCHIVTMGKEMVFAEKFYAKILSKV